MSVCTLARLRSLWTWNRGLILDSKENFSVPHIVLTDSAVQAAFDLLGTRVFPQGQIVRGIKPTIHQLVPRLRMCGPIPPHHFMKARVFTERTWTTTKFCKNHSVKAANHKFYKKNVWLLKYEARLKNLFTSFCVLTEYKLRIKHIRPWQRKQLFSRDFYNPWDHGGYSVYHQL